MPAGMLRGNERLLIRFLCCLVVVVLLLLLLLLFCCFRFRFRLLFRFCLHVFVVVFSLFWFTRPCLAIDRPVI